MKNKILQNKKNISLFLFAIFLILFFSFSVFAYTSSHPQYTQSGFGYSSGIFGGTAETFDSRMCEAGQDFVLQVSPTGCTPAVVRSDLLEEQDTWVYCPIAATKINPLIKIEAINYLTFRNEEFSKYVSDIGFHPVRSALGVQDKVTNPVLENIGYAVVKLKRIPTEAEMPDFVEGNVTARLVYDIENAFGTFRTGFYLKPMKDEEWNKEFLRYGFWRGKGYIRAEDVQSDKATISVYSGNTISRSAGTYQQKLATFSLKPGEESQQIYLPTFDYCLGGLKVKLEDVKDPETTARLKINADDVEVVRGERFLDNKCTVNKIEKIGLNQKVIISCEEDLTEGGFLGFGSSKTFKLEIKPKIELKIDDKTGNYSIGEWLFDSGEKSVFLSYAYTKKDSPYSQDLRVVFTALPKEDVGSRKQLTDDELNSFKGFIERYRKDEPESGAGDFWETSWNIAEGIGFLFEISSRWAISGESFDVLGYRESNNLPEELGISDEQTKQVTVLGLASPSDSEAMKDNSDYKNAVKDFDILYSDFSSIKDVDIKNVPEYGQQAFEEKIKLARDTGQKKTMYELCEQFKAKYPDANIDEICFNEFEFASGEISSADVLIDNKVREISLRSIYEPTFDEYGAKILVKFPDGKRNEIPLQKNDIVYLATKGTANLPEKLDESQALKIVSDEGIKWKDSVKFAGVRPQTLLEIADLKEKCNCEITITSVTDGKHASGEFSHGTGYKIDLRSKDISSGEGKKLFDYINSNFAKMPDRKESDGTSSKQWKNKAGAIYALEYEGTGNEHWDILVAGEKPKDFVPPKFSNEKDKEAFDSADECSDCQNLLGTGCTEKLCNAIAGKTGLKCMDIVSTPLGISEFWTPGFLEGVACVEETDFLEDVDECGDCQDWLGSGCTEKLCKSIAGKTGLNCKSVVSTPLGISEGWTPGFLEGVACVEEEINTDVEISKKDENQLKSSNHFIQLKELETTANRNFAVVRINIPKEFWSESFKFTDSIKLEEDVPEVVSTKDGIYEFTLTKVNLKKVAKISVLPKINYAESESKFSFKIGIDKRDIKLAPEKTKERIEKLNKTIEDFEKVSEVMGKTIQGLKGACLGVGGALHIKNLANNMGGKGIARQTVMRGDGGWYEICANMVNSGKYKTQEQCLIKESENIDKDVQTMTKTLAQQQADIKIMQNKYKSDAEFLEEKIINTKDFAGEYSGQIKNNLGSEIINEINAGKSPSEQINLGEMQNILANPEGFDKNLYDAEELRNIDLSIRTLNNPEASSGMKESAKANLYSTLLDVQKNSKSFVAQTSWAKELGIESSQISTFILKDAKEIPYTEIMNNGKIPELDANIPVQPIQTSTGKQYLIALDESAGTDVLTIKRDSEKEFMVYDKIGNRVSKAEAEELENIYFKKYDKSSYANPFKRSANHNTPVVEYYDTEAYKNLPAVVPFDLKNGWYAAARQNLPVLGNIKSYDGSGRVNNFYLCNVGADGIEEFFSGIGDDSCQQIFLESSKTYRSFPGLSSDEANLLVESAVSAIEQASTARSRNPNLKIGETIRINTRVGGVINVRVGNPAVEVPDIQCQDFMSPKECNLIFNLCDPVICPNSRCDFGGEYVVKDVIQSGIAGSTLLCLPNWKEKIYAPVCLTGIQAGVDGFNSVLKASKDCLQTSLDTGETVGICDEIQSVYMCEFFWRQAAPIGKIGISKVMAKIFGQGTRGGGEYLSVANAWESASKSAEYFTQSYGTNSYAAFKARTSAEQLATPVCKGFISGAVPKLETFFNAVTEPDSPIQFTARFDEIPYSDVTVPPVSQYKVFYHIYAGKDKPVYYRVYLKPDAEGSLYADASMFRNVASGFIPLGEIATETKDFTAPSGYRQLCINANGQEECGFKEVSTSFAVDYVKDKYAQEQITKTGVDSEKECVSGTPSLYNFLTPNIQSSAEGAISPEIYKRGITRICATNNPGQGTDSSRWLEVGRCSDVGQNVKCWLDQQSTEDSIQFAGTRNKTITELEKIWIKGLNLSENYEKDFNLEFEEIEKLGKTEEGLRGKISKATGLLGKTFFNKQKAKVFFERGKAYAELAKLAYKKWKDKEIKYLGEDDEDKKVDDEKPVKFEETEFKSAPLRFVISDPDRNFELFFGFADEQWNVWSYSQEFQYDYSGTSGGNTLTGAKEEDGELVGVGGEWVAIEEAVNRLEEFGGLNEDEKKFIISFTEKVGDYDSGLKQLIDKTSEIKDGKLIKGNIEMSDKKIFKISEFPNGIILEGIEEIYFYNKNKWFWNFYDDELDNKDWSAVPEIKNKSRVRYMPVIDSDYDEIIMPQDVQSLIKSLPNKNFYDGAEIIFEYKAISEEEEKIESEEIISTYDKFIKESSEKYNLDFNLIKAVIKVESNFNPLAISDSGAVGLMQLMPGTARDLGLKVPSQFTNENPGTKSEIENNKENDERFNSEKNINAGTKYLGSLLDKYKKKKYSDYEKLALAAYNGGPGAIGVAISKTGLRDDQITWEKVKEQIEAIETKNYPEKVINVKVSLGSVEFSNFESRLINEAKQCGDCGTMGFFGFGATCAENICSEIGKKLNRECEFSIVIPLGKNSNCFESQNFLRSLNNVSQITANLVGPNNVNNFNWSIANSLIILENTIKIYPQENGRKYSDNKYFVDQLYKRKFLLEEEYNEISGEGLFDNEEDMKFVLELLTKKYFVVGSGGQRIPLTD